MKKLMLLALAAMLATAPAPSFAQDIVKITGIIRDFSFVKACDDIANRGKITLNDGFSHFGL